MSDRFEDDLMDDLMAEPEGRSASADEYDEADAYDEADEMDEADELDEADEDEADEDEGDELEAFEGDESADEFIEGIASILGAEDADEFFGGFKNILKTVGSVARKVAPIAKMIPIPQAQLIGGAADMIGNVLADEGDEFDALDAMADYADEEDGFDALAPAVAGLAIRSALKHKAAAIPRVHRQKLVKAVSTATKHLARKHGAHAAVAAPAIVRAARKIVVRRGLTAKHLPGVVKRVAQVALRSPRAMRKLVHTGSRMRVATPSALRTGGHRGLRRRRYRGVGFSPTGLAGGLKSRAIRLGRNSKYSTGGVADAGGNYCAHCRRRTFHLRGPVSLTIHSR